MTTDDLHARLAALPMLSLEVDGGGDRFRCQVFVTAGERFGEGTGRNVAEAIEGALDDMDYHDSAR